MQNSGSEVIVTPVITGGEFHHLHSLLSVIVERELGPLAVLPEGVKQILARGGSAAGQTVPESLVQWIALLDMAVSPYLLRNFVKEHNPDEETIRDLVRFLVSRKPHSQADRDKVDWLATELYKMHKEKSNSPTGWPKIMVQEMLQALQFDVLSRHAEELLMEFPSLLDEIKDFQRFNQITGSRILERSRDLKNLFGEEFFHPDVLSAVVNYNLMFGRKFEALLHEVLDKADLAAHDLPKREPSELKELLQSDYRSTGGALRNLGEIEIPKKEKEKEMTPVSGSMPALSQLVEKPSADLAGLGIDAGRQLERLRNRIKEISQRLRSNPQFNSIPEPLGTLLLADWECAAFRAEFPESEESFRASFARGLCTAIGIVSRISEELPAYHETKGTEYYWKQHCDALIYLLLEGRRHKETLQNLAADSQKRGLSDKSKQLSSTLERMDSYLTKVAALF